MPNIRKRLFGATYLLFLCFLAGCANEDYAVQGQRPLGGFDLEFVGDRVELQNPVPRNGEEVEVTVTVRNRGDQSAKKIPVFFYDNLKVFSTEEIDVESRGQRRLSAKWKATPGSHVISVVLDPAHHFKEMRREKSEVSTTASVR